MAYEYEKLNLKLDKLRNLEVVYGRVVDSGVAKLAHARIKE